MKEFIGKEVILWDFDGVIVDSMAVREKGFRETLKDFPEEEVDRLIAYHQKNGGLSRYVKYRYFFEKIRKEHAVQQEVAELSAAFSDIMRTSLIHKSILIPEVIDFIKNYKDDFKMHIVSGSDEEELRFLCEQLGISSYFISVEGSPTPKIELVKNLLKEYKYNKEKACLIGDSVNDKEAAEQNDISFYGYNNKELKEKNAYINTFQ
ncbi:HAD-IA family hydrolase [Zunongwangia sp. F363]|uniref:phosphoglycolate phosphatase n=1 Tax=Autumnicola tepida TaxID=3075595 RepID=A0ABU3CE13_9FLAO|nr:HAD-IA family hydrolase [Zunongwangia sp. F363]MDT0644583.1 HAD-IA family hydrolase [Zunongwangia sp. F363]